MGSIRISPRTAPDCSIAQVDEEGFYGFDVFYLLLPDANQPTVISNDPAEGSPNQGFPLMGYKQEQFADAYHWCVLLETYGVDCDEDTVPFQAFMRAQHLARSVGSGAAVPALNSGSDAIRPEAGPFLFVTGLVQQKPLEAAIDLVMSLPQAPADFQEHPELSRRDSGFELALLDANGQVLAAVPIEETTINHEALNSIAFLAGLPLEPGAASLEIRHQSQTLAKREFSPGEPTVELLTPNGGEVYDSPFEIRRQGADPDDDALTYTLQYSPDGGGSWQALAFALTGASYQVLSLHNLTGSDQAKICVIASDGANSAFDESERVFNVPNTPPLPVIQLPGHLAVFPLGARVPLIGSATDREDGVLPAESLIWESNLDGFLGSGEGLEPDDLSPGNHVLTLTAEDSAGLFAQAHVGVVIDGNNPRPIPGDDELALASLILAAGPGGYTPESAGGAPPPILGAIALAGIVGAALFIPLLRSLLRR